MGISRESENGAQVLERQSEEVLSWERDRTAHVLFDCLPEQVLRRRLANSVI